MPKQFHVYIMTNKSNDILYIGVTSDLVKRVAQHRNKMYEGFTSKYNCSKLVYFEAGGSAEGAIAREKQLKAGSRKKKIDLIKRQNPEWRDLYEDIMG
jgi:putative endonuclease